MGGELEGSYDKAKSGGALGRISEAAMPEAGSDYNPRGISPQRDYRLKKSTVGEVKPRGSVHAL